MKAVQSGKFTSVETAAKEITRRCPSLTRRGQALRAGFTQAFLKEPRATKEAGERELEISGNNIHGHGSKPRTPSEYVNPH